jgi:hypothetical protein
MTEKPKALNTDMRAGKKVIKTVGENCKESCKFLHPRMEKIVTFFTVKFYRNFYREGVTR